MDLIKELRNAGVEWEIESLIIHCPETKEGVDFFNISLYRGDTLLNALEYPANRGLTLTEIMPHVLTGVSVSESFDKMMNSYRGNVQADYNAAALTTLGAYITEDLKSSYGVSNKSAVLGSLLKTLPAAEMERVWEKVLKAIVDTLTGARANRTKYSVADSARCALYNALIDLIILQDINGTSEEDVQKALDASRLVDNISNLTWLNTGLKRVIFDKFLVEEPDAPA